METIEKTRVRVSQHGYNRTVDTQPQRLRTIPKKGLVTDVQVMKVLSHNLGSLRIRCGLTQRELSEAAKIPLNSIGSYEEGRCEPPMAKLLALAGVLGVTLSQLLMPASND
jgi:DNA-binding XRE family transcriptional regulator